MYVYMCGWWEGGIDFFFLYIYIEKLRNLKILN